MLGTQVAKALEEFFVGLDEARVTNNRFQDDGGDFVLILLKNCFNLCQIIVLSAECGLGGAGGHARTVGQAQGGDAGTGLDKEGIRVAVVASLEFDDLLPIGVSTAEADHAHACLGSRVGKTDHFNGWDCSDDGLGKFVLECAGGTEGSSCC